MVEHSTHNPKFKVWNPTNGNGREKNSKNVAHLLLYSSSTEVEHSIRDPRIEGLNPSTVTEKYKGKMFAHPWLYTRGLYHKTYYGHNLKFP